MDPAPWQRGRVVTPNIAVGLALGLLLGCALLTLLAALAGWQPHLPLRARFASSPGQAKAVSARWLASAAVGVVTTVLTRWPVAGVAAALLVHFWPRLLGAGPAAAAQIVRLEALATWTESLRDSIAGSVGLAEAIRHSLAAAPPALVPALERLEGQLAAHVPLPQGLRRFADQLEDASADLVVGALILNSQLRGPGLVATLGALATSTRDELDLRRRIEESRKSLRRTAAIIIGSTALFAAALTVFSREYVAPYATVTGQLVLVVVLAIFATGLMWIRAAADVRVPERFLSGEASEHTAGGRR